MGVGVQREARGVMTEHRGHGFYIHAVLQRHRCEGVPLRYNYDKPEKPRKRKTSQQGGIQSTMRHEKPCGNERGPPRKAKYSLVTDSA